MSEQGKKPASARHRRRSGPVSVGALVPDVARPALEAHGFPSASLITDWADIIGTEFAGFTAPERLSWPRRFVETDDDVPAPRDSDCATLILRVQGPRALEVQHAVPQLMERINTYFGYRAIGRIRIVQGPVTRSSDEGKPHQATSEPIPPADLNADHIKDPDLRHAIERLGARVSEKKVRTPDHG